MQKFCENLSKIAHEHKDTYASLSSKHNLSATIAKTFHFNLHWNHSMDGPYCRGDSDLYEYSWSSIPDQNWRKYIMLKTRCVGIPTRMSLLWILRRLANVSPFFNSLSNRLRITNEFQSWSVTYDYTLSFQKSSQYLKS